MGGDGRGIAGEEMLVVADPDDHRAPEPRADDLVWRVPADDGQAVGSFEHREDPEDGIE